MHLALVAALIASSAFAAPLSPALAAGAARPAAGVAPPDDPARCGVQPGGAAAGDPSARESAQRGIDFLARATAQWARTNRCYGCHVQAVTLEGLAAGKSHQYDVPQRELEAIVDSMLQMSGGARGPQGLFHPGFPKTARIFGGVAFARYDQWVGGALRDDLYKVARQLLEYQVTDGSVRGDHESRPVTAGVVQSTYQAMQTWRQAWARSADASWLGPIQRAERYLETTAAGWRGGGAGVYLQDVNYALLGLIAAGATASEGTAQRLVSHLVSLQQRDGGWGFAGQSDAYATGQTVTALRAAGLTDREGPVARGIAWLVAHQQRGGGWGAAGSGKAEAMWAVLGLVSVDVATVSLHGLADGQRVAGVIPLELAAKDNGGQGIARVELRVDDVAVRRACGADLSLRWNAGALAAGKHLVDAVAWNVRGQESRRRYQVYAGDVFLAQLAARWEDGPEAGTRISARDLAGDDRPGAVRLAIFAADAAGKARGPELFAAEQRSAPGALAFAWDGKGRDGRLQPRGRYLAQLSFVAGGRTLQTESILFVQDTEEAQARRFAQVEGALALHGGGAANTVVELLDEKGEVVQKTVTTEAGQYRFKDVEEGRYTVRVKKDGFRALEAPAAAAPGKATSMGVQSL